MSTPEIPLTKTYTDCGRDLLLDCYGRRYGRRECCKECYAARYSLLRTKRRYRRIEDYCRDVQRARNSQLVTNLTVALLNAYGGVPGVAKEFREYMDWARENDASGRAAFAGLPTLMKLCGVSRRLPEAELPRISSLTNST